METGTTNSRVERRKSLSVGAQPNFIGCWSALSAADCKSLIEVFEAQSEHHTPGKFGRGVLNESAKKSIDLRIDPYQLDEPRYAKFRDYFESLHSCYQDYCDQWDFLHSFAKRLHIGSFNVQKYEAGGHYSLLHAERTSFSNLPRFLAWMTYLNDVETGGETEFPHYALKVKPVAGQTLIWPSDWTHAHRGCPVVTGPKYIVTGWLHLPG